jgi:hypothetical protein
MRKLILFIVCCLAVYIFAALIYTKSPFGEQVEPASSTNGAVTCAHGANCSHNHAAYGDSKTKRPASRYPMVDLDEPVLASGSESVAKAQAGDRLKLNFGEDLQLDARVVGSEIFSGNDRSISMKLIGQKGSIYWLRKANGNVMGNIFLKDGNKNIIYKYNGQDDDWVIQQVDQQDFVCSSGNTDESVGMPTARITYTPGEQTGTIPLLNSLPGAEAVAYIDFDGEVVSGTRWVNGGTINAEPAGFDEARIRQVWEEVAEDMRPFKINVTTERAIYDAAAQNKKMMCIVTPTNDAAPGAGGVAYLDSFHDGFTDPCWAFNLSIGSCAMTISHEVGHTFGLRHDGLEGQQDQTTYHTGNGTWGPIMGAPFGLNIVSWSDGGYQGSTNTEDDLDIIATLSADFREDQYGDSDNDAFDVAGEPNDEDVDLSGIIETPDDVDVFSFTTNGGPVTLGVEPEVLTINKIKLVTNMNISIKLYNEAGELVAEDDPVNSYGASITTELELGSYTFHVTGTNSGSPDVDGFADYGSIGQYAITGNIPGLGGDGDLTPPSANLSNPSNGEIFDLPLSGAQAYLDVTFVDDGQGIDPSTIDGDELSLSGTGLGDAVLEGSAEFVSGTTYRYAYTGSFVEGLVSVEFVAGSFADLASTTNFNLTETEGFTVEVVPFSQIIDDSDAGFSTTGEWNTYTGNELVNGYNAAFTYSAAGTGNKTATWTFSGLIPGKYEVAITWHDREIYRASNASYTVYDSSTMLSSAQVSQLAAPTADHIRGGEPFDKVFAEVDIDSGTLVLKLSDDANSYVVADAVRIELLIPSGPDIIAPTAKLVNPPNGSSIATDVLNAQRYIEVSYADFGDGIDLFSIDGDELILNGNGANSVTINNGAPTQDGDNYRYNFTGDFVNGNVKVEFAAGTFADQATTPNVNVAETEGFTVVNQPGQPSSEIIDDSDTGFTATSGWQIYSGNLFVSGYNTGLTYSRPTASSEIAQWTFTGLSIGSSYQVAVSWNNREIFRAQNANYTVHDGTTMIDSTNINQRVAPNSDHTENDKPFDIIFDSVQISSGTLVLKLSSVTDDYVVADAVRIELVSPAQP